MALKQCLIIFFVHSTLFKGYHCESDVKGAYDFVLPLINTLDESGYSDESWVVSPISIQLVLEQIYLGAGGHTKEELATTLGLSSDDSNALTQITDQQHEIQASPDNGVVWKTANSILVNDNFILNSAYTAMVTSLFHSEVANINFADAEKAVTTINSWVSNHTGGHIKELISSGDAIHNARMVLLNAVYFNGIWKYSFKESETTELCFYSSPANCSLTDMMNQERDFKYGVDTKLGAKIIQLPYNDTKYSMVIVLPLKIDGLKDVVSKLSSSQLNKFITQMKYGKVDVTVPKFTSEFNISLRNPLKKMGIDSIFQGTADFSVMTSENGLYVSDVIHKASISVSETGTVAAAATGAVMARNLDFDSDVSEFYANHPFLYFILLNNEEILFVGQYVKTT